MENIYKRINYSNKNFRKNINYLIARDNVTKSFLDTSLEIGEGSISRYCKEDNSAIEPKIGIVNSLAKAFGVTIDDLINGDIQKREKEVLQNSQRKDILFCNKLIKETKENLCEWEQLNLNNDSHIHVEYCDYCDYGYYESNFFDSEGKFKSKFTYELYGMNELNGFTVIINSNVKVFISKFTIYQGEEESFEPDKFIDNYELYLIKETGEVIPSCSSYRYLNEDSKIFEQELLYDEVLDNVLKELYQVVSDYIAFGKDNFEKEFIFEEYLYGLPF